MSSDLSGFDIHSFLLCIKIWIDVCPWSGIFYSSWQGSVGCLHVARALSMFGPAICPTLCTRSRAVAWYIEGEAVSHGSWKEIFFNFHWSRQHLLRWTLWLEKLWSPGYSLSQSNNLPIRCHGILLYLICTICWLLPFPQRTAKF